MATSIYMSSGDEFCVSQDYEEVLGMFADPARQEDGVWVFDLVNWRNPDHADFDTLIDIEQRPVYSLTSIAIRPTEIVAVERFEAALERILARAEAYQREHS